MSMIHDCAYKRRRLQRNSVIVFSEEMVAADCQLCIFSEDLLASDALCSVSAFKHNCSNTAGVLSSECDGQLNSAILQTKGEASEDCSSSDVVGPCEFISTQDLCISAPLGSNALPKGASVSVEFPCNDNDAILSLKCKICEEVDSPVHMLICDLCEEAHHPSCCNPRVRKLPVEEWFCQPCRRDKLNGMNQKGTSNGGLNSISSMLSDFRPYTSRVRIGKDFQAEIPEWSSAPSSEDTYFLESIELDASESTYISKENVTSSNRYNNWIQCKKLMDTGGANERILCKKWRRAPFHVIQTKDWDCSCAVVWDPKHADCAVPQELETNEVLEQLRYIKKLRRRLDKKSAEQPDSKKPKSV